MERSNLFLLTLPTLDTDTWESWEYRIKEWTSSEQTWNVCRMCYTIQCIYFKYVWDTVHYNTYYAVHSCELPNPDVPTSGEFQGFSGKVGSQTGGF